MADRRPASRPRRRLLAALGHAGIALPLLPLLIRDLLAAGSDGITPGRYGAVKR
ncbi:MAG: hypothetical protein ACOZDY_18230 [Pseudomonadota bacterium]